MSQNDCFPVSIGRVHIAWNQLADPELAFFWGVVCFDGGLGLPHWANRTSETF